MEEYLYTLGAGVIFATDAWAILFLDDDLMPT